MEHQNHACSDTCPFQNPIESGYEVDCLEAPTFAQLCTAVEDFIILKNPSIDTSSIEFGQSKFSVHIKWRKEEQISENDSFLKSVFLNNKNFLQDISDRTKQRDALIKEINQLQEAFKALKLNFGNPVMKTEKEFLSNLKNSVQGDKLPEWSFSLEESKSESVGKPVEGLFKVDVYMSDNFNQSFNEESSLKEEVDSLSILKLFPPGYQHFKLNFKVPEKTTLTIRGTLINKEIENWRKTFLKKRESVKKDDEPIDLGLLFKNAKCVFQKLNSATSKYMKDIHTSVIELTEGGLAKDDLERLESFKVDFSCLREIGSDSIMAFCNKIGNDMLNLRDCNLNFKMCKQINWKGFGAVIDNICMRAETLESLEINLEGSKICGFTFENFMREICTKLQKLKRLRLTFNRCRRIHETFLTKVLEDPEISEYLRNLGRRVSLIFEKCGHFSPEIAQRIKGRYSEGKSQRVFFTEKSAPVSEL